MHLSRKRVVVLFGCVFFLISPAHLHVRPTGRTCRRAGEIELTPVGVGLNGSRRVRVARDRAVGAPGHGMHGRQRLPATQTAHHLCYGTPFNTGAWGSEEQWGTHAPTGSPGESQRRAVQHFPHANRASLRWICFVFPHKPPTLDYWKVAEYKK